MGAVALSEVFGTIRGRVIKLGREGSSTWRRLFCMEIGKGDFPVSKVHRQTKFDYNFERIAIHFPTPKKNIKQC